LHRNIFALLMLVVGLWACGMAPALAADPAIKNSLAVAGSVSDAPETTDPEAASEPVVPPPLYLTAKVVVIELAVDDGTEAVSQFQFQRHGDKALVTGESREGDQFEAEAYYDYGNHEIYRKLTTDEITFSYRMLTRERVQAQIHGLMPTPSYEPRYRMVVNENVEFDGHPCTLTLVGFPVGGSLRALRWVWEAQDLDDQVVRVVFPDNYDRIVTIEYLDASNEPFDPALVKLPEGTMVMSSF